MDIEKSNQIAQKYYVRRAAAERNVKFTFAKDGFYQTLKRRVVQKLKESPKTLRSKTNVFKRKNIIQFKEMFYFQNSF